MASTTLDLARRRWPLAVAALAAILALGPASVGVDALPQAPPGPAAGRGPAAAAVDALVGAPAGADPLAAVPDDFAVTMGYSPVATTMADGTVRPVKPGGACSAPGGGTRFGFDQACKAHDYGYDLLRYADATGRPLDGQARRRLDAMLARDLHARCAVTAHGLNGLGCHLAAEAFTTGAAFNSWRQQYGNPVPESASAWLAGLARAALTRL